MKSIEIRQKFFDFFKEQNHEEVPSSPLIPPQDPTLLFANAGMNQFKDVFLGKETRSYKRAVSIQKCMRAGGKHNDLDNVGFTKRHLTFFEMMGNFSFGDYFKKEAIDYAWRFLTVKMKLNTKNLVVSVYKDDDEAYDIWHKKMGLPREKVYRLGADNNFWQMGDTGPCGPCSEIYVDKGPEVGCKEKSCDPSCSCERFFEIWNLVFMQFDRQSDGTDKPLKQTGVDTGMGFERLCAVMQNVDSVYQTDLFIPIIGAIEKLTGKKYVGQSEELKAAFHVLADHIRACCFAIADGASPSNEGRGYVLRKIIRRAALFERKLTSKSIFPQLAQTLIDLMGNIYPELKTNESLINSVLKNEIEKFVDNLDRGYPILEDLLVTNIQTKIIPGNQAFRLYDTFGFPLELVIARAKEKGFTVEIEEFEHEMEKQRMQSSKKQEVEELQVELDPKIKTEFTGYSEAPNFALEIDSEVVTLVCDNKKVERANVDSSCWIITKKSPFFVECGGQVDDKGWIEIQGKKITVEGLKKIDGAIAILVKTPESVKVGDQIRIIVDSNNRESIMKNHTATHLLQAALVEMLGKQIKQAGSLVTPDHLRFDFTYHQNLTTEQIKEIEDQVNQKIMENIALKIFETTHKDAIEKGVTAIFGEKYNPEKVRVIEIEKFSAELCGGTHVRRTGDIGTFKITEMSALSAGTRRIVGVTGVKAVELMQDNFNVIKKLSQEFKVKPEEVLGTVEKQAEQIKQLQTNYRQLKKQLFKSQIPEWATQVSEINNIPYLYLSLVDCTSEEMKDIAQTLNQKRPGFYFLISEGDGRTIFFATIAKEYAEKINMREFGAWLQQACNLRGGGSAMQLQGGGEKVPADLESKITGWLKG